MALATIQHLVDIGAIRADTNGGDADHQRAEGLLRFASAAVCIHYGVDESDITTDWTAAEQTLVAYVVAECAAQRLTSPAAATAQQLPDGFSEWTKVFLTPAMKRALNQIHKPGRGTSSATISFASSNPVEWTNWPSYGLMPHDEDSFS